MDGLMQELAGEPSLERIDSILSTILRDFRGELNQTSPLVLELCSILLNHTWPSVGQSLPSKSRDKFVKVLSNLSGISNICSTIGSIVESLDKNSAQYLRSPADRTRAESHVKGLCQLLADLLQPGVINLLLVNININEKRYTKKRIETREVIALFSGSKIFTRVSFASRILEDFDSPWIWISEGSKYCEFLAQEISLVDNKHVSEAADLLEMGLKLGYENVFGKVLLNKQNIQKVNTLCNHLRPANKEYILTHWILPYFQTTYLEYPVEDTSPAVAQRIGAIARIISTLSIQGLEASLYKYAGSGRPNFQMRRVVALSVSNHVAVLVPPLLEDWGDKLAIESNPMLVQKAQTQLLFISISLMNPEIIKRTVSSSKIYLDSISNRLGALSNTPRLLGTLMAEHVSKCSGDEKPLKFDLGTFDQEELERWRGVIGSIKDAFCPSDQSPWQVLEQANVRVLEPDTSIHQESKKPPLVAASSPTVHRGFPENTAPKTQTARIVELDSDDDIGVDELQPYPMPEDDFEDSDDDPTLVSRERVSRPVYIKDLVEYLDKGSENYERLHLALAYGADLIQAKANYGQEVSFYSKQLAVLLAGLQDSFDMEEFQDRRLQMLQTLVACSPENVPPYLSELLMCGDYSLQQRLTILSSLALGAKQLAGNVMKSTSATKQLPGALHQMFKDDDMNALTIQLQKSLLEETSSKIQDELIGGPQILRMSRKLEKQRQGETVVYIRSAYAKLAASKFFFPLIGQWQAHGGMKNIGAYSEILAGHFIKTLAILLHTAYPSSTELVDMSAELLELVLRHRGAKKVVIIEALLTCILVILDVSNPEFVVQSWPSQIVELQTWLDATWKDIPDSRVQSLAAGVLYRLTELASKWERLLVGEYSRVG